MVIKKIRKRTKLSQNEFAQKFGIPVRTLQQWEQGISEPLPYLLSLIQDEITDEEYLDMTKFIIKPQTRFKKICNFTNAERVHAAFQRAVNTIVEDMKEDPNVVKTIIFGSTITDHCTFESDIDIYVELLNNKPVKQSDINIPVDLWTNFSVTPDMLKEIKKKGVVIYER